MADEPKAATASTTAKPTAVATSNLASAIPGTTPEKLAEELGIEIENMPDTGELAEEDKPVISVDFEEGTAKPYVVLSNGLVAARFQSKEEALSNATRFVK